MNLFKKNIGKNRLLKLYKAVSQSDAEAFDTRSLIHFLLNEFDQLHLNLEHFYVTGPYPNNGWKTKKGFLDGLNKKDFKNVHHLMISDSDELMRLNFRNWSHNRTIKIDSDSIVIELMFDENTITDKGLVSLGKRLFEVLSFEYGYIFSQSKIFSISEGKIKNGIFFYSEKENAEYQKWSKYSAATKFGFIRNVYKLNFLSPNHLENEDLNKVVKSIGQLNTYDHFSIWTLTDSEVEQALKLLNLSSVLVKNESFNDTEICQKIDDEIKKIYTTL
ncbi:hypothetical protein K6119_04215 [Paracrocinitomix mangrovi]|uniref:hypothetical protein n=1 Tax=Paracrocinitomix mangrovi TaxID=2862509 RepID=UPI001C8E7BD4|nr:hypothetical protein [Paracrocinitomix mangrovi]UKN02718.1 hypothetical protein K6119_04215 [Paracrocinitomix mangrovi]